MKVLGQDAARNPDNVRRFVREAQITAELDHPNIVPLYERGQDRHGNHYFTMKRVDGQTLAEWIDAVGRPTKAGEVLQRMLAAVTKVCDGLAFAHSRGVLHCDVKPENIMVGSFGQAYLMDWGVACSMDERPKAAWLPVQIPARDDPAMPLFRGGLNGTPAFMAPEQAFGYTHLVDERTDVFGLGAVLYTILVGRPPFAGTDMNAVLSEARACAVTFPDAKTDAGEPFPPGLFRIAARAMARDRHNRYQSVLDLQRALQAATEAVT
jgi:serine/threonine-protein kinase